MSVKLWTNVPQQFLNNSAGLLSGGKLFTYTAGSSTKQTTYQDSAGVTSHANPILLDTNGRLPAEVWLTSGVSYKFVLTSSTDTDPPTSPIQTWDNLSGINDTTVTLDEWVSGPTPTYVSATQFTLVGDQTSTFHVGRRVKCTVTAGTVYGVITASAYTTLTTLTVVIDSGSLDSGLSAVSYGLLGASNPAIPITQDSYAIVSGSSDRTKKVRMEVDTNVPTGTTVVLTVPGNDITLGNWSTGDVKLTLKTTADTGWVLMDDGTIGDASSGASTRANADTASLFTLLWNNTADADCAVSTGRGASAAADYAAHKTIALPKALGRALACYGSGSGLTARALAHVVGEETHVLTTTEMPSHTHGIAYNATLNGGGAGANVVDVGSSVNTASAGSDGAHNNMQPTVFLNVMIKL